MQTKHFHELDGMRGALACTVMLYHFGLNTLVSKASGGRLRDGTWDLCVDFFFILSGFVLARSFALRPVGLPAYGLKRVFRLAPMFILATLAVLAIKPEAWPIGVISANLFIVQSVIGLPSINFPAWSIPYELFFPAVFLVLIPRLRRSPVHALTSLLVALLLAHSIVAYQLAIQADDPAAFGASRASFGLLAGATLYLLHESTAKPNAYNKAWAAAAMSCVFVIMAVSGSLPASATVFPFAAAGAVWFGATSTGVFSTRPFQELGRSSYSIYLTHIPVLYLAQHLVGEAAVRGWGSKAVLVAIVILVSSLLYRFVELPFIRIGESLRRTDRLPQAPGTEGEKIP